LAAELHADWQAQFTKKTACGDRVITVTVIPQYARKNLFVGSIFSERLPLSLRRIVLSVE